MADATRRLALVNMDWDQIKAEDIYTLVYSFKPQIGAIVSVTVYPSKFGRERMARETIEGPPKELFSGKKDSNDGSSSSSSEHEDDGEDMDEIALRKVSTGTTSLLLRSDRMR